MWKQKLLYRILGILSNSEESCRAAAEFLGCGQNTAAPDVLREDHRETVHMFLNENSAAYPMVRCLAYMATAKLDPYTLSDRNDTLIEGYNASVEAQNRQRPVGARHRTVDLFRMYALLDMVGKELHLGENSAVVTDCPGWLHLLSAYAICSGISVWWCPGQKPSQILLKELPKGLSIPTQMLCWVLSGETQYALLADLSKCRSAKKQREIHSRLVEFLAYGRNLRPRQVTTLCRRVLKEGVSEEELALLLRSPRESTVLACLQEDFGITV